MRNRKLVVVTNNTDTFSNPSIHYLFDQTLKKGQEITLIGPPQQVDICSLWNQVEFIENPHPPIIYLLRSLYLHVLALVRCDRIYKSNSLSDIYWTWRRDLHGCTQEICKIFDALVFFCKIVVQYKMLVFLTIIAIDENGLLQACTLKKFLIFPKLIYFSFEITFLDECINDERVFLRRKYSTACKNVRHYLVQDEFRRTLLLEENGYLRNRKYTILPVAPFPVAYEANELRTSSTMVFAGTFNYCMGVGKILSQIKQVPLPIGFSFELHTFNPSNIQIEGFSLEEAKAISSVSFHLSCFKELSDYYSYLSQFHLAISLYYGQSTRGPWEGKNIEFIGLSSGKFSTYMMLGIPTIVRKVSPYIELLDSYRFGYLIEDLSELNTAILSIMDQRDYYSDEARKLYSEKLSPELYRIPI